MKMINFSLLLVKIYLKFQHMINDANCKEGW